MNILAQRLQLLLNRLNIDYSVDPNDDGVLDISFPGQALEKYDITVCIHPDDPKILFWLPIPLVVSESDKLRVLDFLNSINNHSILATATVTDRNILAFGYYQLVSEQNFEDYILLGLTALSSCADQTLPYICTIINN